MVSWVAFLPLSELIQLIFRDDEILSHPSRGLEPVREEDTCSPHNCRPGMVFVIVLSGHAACWASNLSNHWHWRKLTKSSDRGFTTNSKNKIPLNKKTQWRWETEMDGGFSEVQMISKCMKNGSTFLAIREMQIKTILKFHLTIVRKKG